MSDACRFLSQKWNHSIGRSTIYDALQSDPALKALAKQCEGVTFDVCYRGMAERAEQGSARDQRILFTRLAQNHGIASAQKIEITGADGKPVQHEVIANGELSNDQIDDLSDADLDILIAAERIKNANRRSLSGEAGSSQK